MLHQLTNGNWVDLRFVTEINVNAGRHVAINFGTQHIRVVNFESAGEAEAYRDELAALVNEAQAKKIKPESWRNLPPQI